MKIRRIDSNSSNKKKLILIFYFLYILLGLETQTDPKDKRQLLVIGL